MFCGPSERSWGARLWFRFATSLIRNVFFRYLGGVKLLGVENVPRSGPVIVAPVHFSHLDPPLVGAFCPRELMLIGKDELFESRIFGFLIRSLGTFPIKRGSADAVALKKTIEWLRAGYAVLIFPEGSRGDGETLGPIMSGVGALAEKTGAVVVPVGISGTERALPRGEGKLTRVRCVARFGEPLDFRTVTKDVAPGEARQFFTRALQAALVRACAEAGLEVKTSDPSSTQSGSLPIQTQP